MSDYDDELTATLFQFTRDVQTNSALQEELIQYFTERYKHAMVALEFAEAKGYAVDSRAQEALIQLLTLEKNQLEAIDRYPERAYHFEDANANEVMEVVSTYQSKSMELGFLWGEEYLAVLFTNPPNSLVARALEMYNDAENDRKEEEEREARSYRRRRDID